MKKTMLEKLQLSFVSLAALGLLVACATEPDSDNSMPPAEEQEEATEESTTDTTENVDEKTTESDYASLTLHPEEAFDIFQEEYPNAKITEIQLDKDNGSFVYEVEGFEGTTEYELKIDPMEGNILKENTDTEDDLDDMEITREDVEKVMALVDQAISEADEGAQLKEWTIDEDDGIVKLEIELDLDGFDDQEYTYNVETGELLEIDN